MLIVLAGVIITLFSAKTQLFTVGSNLIAAVNPYIKKYNEYFLFTVIP